MHQSLLLGISLANRCTTLRTFIVALLLSLTVVTAHAQSGVSMNMELFDHLNPVDSVGPHSSLWGYLAPDGREYAIFGAQNGTYVIDVTVKPIRIVSFIPGPHGPWREMKVYDHYAYVVNENRGDSLHGLQIIDLSGLPTSAQLVRTDTSVFLSAHTVFVRDHYLLAMGTNPETGAKGGTIIFDLAPDPLHPQRVGVVDPYYHHDSWMRNDTLLGAAVYGQGCDIYDVRDKAHPIHLATITYPGSGTHNAEMTRDGHYVVTSDEVGTTLKTMKVWDISDLDNITKVADYSPSPIDIVHNVHIIGRYAYVAWYTAGVRIIDMIDPRHPRQVGFYDTYPGAGGSYNGVWESFAGFPNGKVIASDRQTGLWVFTFNGATAGSISGTVRDATTGDPIAGARLYLSERNDSVETDAAGHYYIGGANGESVSISIKRFPYRGVSESFTINDDIVHDIPLSKLPLIPVVVDARDASGTPLSSFHVAVEPFIHSTAASGPITISLPADSTFTITVGEWGYRIEEKPTTVHEGDTVAFALERRYQDNATLDLGWALQDPADNAVTGRWVRTIPYVTVSSGWFHPLPEPGDRAGYIFQTGLPPPTLPSWAGDVSSGYTTLISPSFDLSSYNDPTISFDLWFVHVINGEVRDTLAVQLSNDDGATWVDAYREVQGIGGWRTHQVYPRDLLTLTSTMRMRFRTSDSLGNASVFAAVDNVDIDPLRIASSVGGDERRSAHATIEIDVVPNPIVATGSISIRANGNPAVTITMVNALGECVAFLARDVRASHLNPMLVPELPSGSYTIVARSNDGAIATRRISIVR